MARILVVDDDPAIRNLVAAVMGKRGHDVVTAWDAREGLVIASSKFDLIVTDVMMPLIDGWDFVRVLRSWTETALIPVVFLTALDKESDQIKGFRLGADDYIAKPFDPKDLAVRLEAVLDRAKGLKASFKEQFHPTEPSIKGSLSHIGVSAVLTLLDLEKKSGDLVLHGPGGTARLTARQGRIVSAQMDGGKGPFGPECVFHALQWPDGTFGFFPRDTSAEPDRMNRSTASLLMEAARMLDESARKRR